MQTKNATKTLLKGALILSLASLIAKILSAFYRVPFENIVGNTGFYVYQQVYPLYGIGMTFALSGFPVFISKLIAEQEGQLAKVNLARRLFVILSFFAGGIFIFLQLTSGLIANSMGDGQLELLIKSVSFMFLFMPLLAVGRGYYQGTFNMVPTAISQVSEQLVRVAVILLAAYLFTKRGWTYYEMGAWAMAGATIGALCASLSFSKFYLGSFLSQPFSTSKLSMQTLIRRLLSEGLIICLFASLMVLLQLVDSFTVKQALEVKGFSSELAKEIKGTYDRSQPLVQLGIVVAVSFSSTLLPSLTEALQKRHLNEFRKTAKALLRISVGLGAAATVGLIALMPEINTVLFGDASLSKTISIYVVSVFMMTLISNYNSLLQSLNQYQMTVIALLAAIVVKALINSYLIERLGIAGASIATVLALIVAQALIAGSLPALLKGLLSGDNYLLKLGLVTGIMGVVAAVVAKVGTFLLPSGRLSLLLVALISVGIGVLVFIGLALWLRLFSIREWLAIPGGKKLLRLTNKFTNRKGLS
ncbi:MAG: oligosaccharide flippase family protein [Ligilactobacillus agilis]|nr:oligosaccharide flippase family protein [Ligilactobacillus agilis]